MSISEILRLKLPRLLKIIASGKEFHSLTTLSAYKFSIECYCYSVLYKVYMDVL